MICPSCKRPQALHRHSRKRNYQPVTVYSAAGKPETRVWDRIRCVPVPELHEGEKGVSPGRTNVGDPLKGAPRMVPKK